MKKQLNPKGALLFLAFILTTLTSQGQLLLEENFSYNTGSLLTNNGWSGHSGTGTNDVYVTTPTISYAGYLSSGIGNQAILLSNGQDVNKSFSQQTSGVVYISFLANISSASTAGDYFFHLGRTVIGTDFKGRIFVKRNTSNKLAFGVAQNTTTANYSDFIYDLNTTYLIVLRYNIVDGSSNDFSEIIINPSLSGSLPVSGWIANTDAAGTDLTNVGSVALRQGTSTTGPSLIIDGIRVSKTWEGITGSIDAPEISASPESLSGFSYIVGKGPSSAQGFVINGSNLVGNITITPPANYEISTESGSSFVPTNQIVVAPTSGSVINKTIYSRLKAGLAVGDYSSQLISISTSGATSISVSCSGTVLPTPEPVNHVISFSANAVSTNQIDLSWLDGTSPAEGYLIKGSETSFEAITNPTDGIAEPNGFLVNNVAAGTQGFSFTGLNSNSNYFFKIFPYNGNGININYKTNQTVPQSSATTLGSPSVNEIIVPRYIQGKKEPNNERVPFACRLELINLSPNTTYRYINQVVLASDGPTFPGAANSIYVNADNTFTRTNNAALSIPGNYGEFTTNASGSYTGRFITEPTGNDRFMAGNELFIRIRLNDGNNGTSAVTFVTTTSPITVLGFGTTSSANQGTAVRGESDASSKNFVFLYDNESGSGRPIYGTSIESTGADFAANSWAPFFRQKVVGKNGAWGGILPNSNANGVKLIQERSLLDGSVVSNKTSANGIWGATNTVSPGGGLSNVLVIATGPVPLTAVDDNATTLINEQVSIEVLNNDITGSTPIILSSIAFVPGTGPDASTQGTFSLNPSTGIVTFTPKTGFLGTVSIDYHVCDMNDFCDVATITVNVIVGLTNYYPAMGPGTLAFEDLWPGKGDYDFNDLVIDYQFELISNPSNFIEQIKGVFVIRAFGASLENGFGFQFSGNFDPYDLTVSGFNLSEDYIVLEPNGIEADQTKPTIIVFDNAFALMNHPGIGTGVNTEPNAPFITPVTLNITINFKPDTYSYNDIDISSFNPFLIVNKNRDVEIHLPNYPPTDLADLSLFGTWDDDSDPSSNRWYVNDKNLPWAINIYESFAYPIERQDILQVHLKFAEWAMSGGTLYPDWYKNLAGYRNNSLIYQVPAK
ncbi:MAG: LruC domain-containing protein [Bacteroidales bacterium]|nr:LruC domain-containing protein [Bacteroidales bacterium]